jgi:hypothetical protein
MDQKIEDEVEVAWQIWNDLDPIETMRHIKNLEEEVKRLKEYEWMYKELCK